MNAPVVLNPQIIGNWQEALRKDNVVKSKLGANAQIPAQGNDNYRQLLAAFKVSPATGMATIINNTRVKAGYDPNEISLLDHHACFMKWIELIKSSNFLKEEYHEPVMINAVDNWQGYLNVVLGYYVGISNADTIKVRASLQKLITAAFSMPGTPERVHMVQNSIQQNANGSVSTYFYFTAVEIKYKEEGKSAPAEFNSHYVIQRIKFNLSPSDWEKYAEEVMGNSIELLTDWLQNVSNRSAIKGKTLACFKTVPSLEDALSVGDVNDYWNNFSWDEFSPKVKILLGKLGWSNNNWHGDVANFSTTKKMTWAKLSSIELAAAKQLGYNKITWDGPSVYEAIRAINMNDYWKAFHWEDLSIQLQALWKQLGRNAKNWASKNNPSSVNTLWGNLSGAEQNAASLLGFTEAIWNNQGERNGIEFL